MRMREPVADSEDFRQPPRRGLRLLVVVAGLAIAGLIAGLLVWLPERLDCEGADLDDRDGQCIGVTDGAPAFLPGEGAEGGAGVKDAFEDIQDKIKKENDAVAREAAADEGVDVVKVGFVGTFTPGEREPTTADRVLSSLRGAYVAQMDVNRSSSFGGARLPKVQLYLANAGSRLRHWEPVVEELAHMADDPVPLRAVIGGWVSSDDTEQAARRLAKHHIPMVSAVASGTGLSEPDIGGLVRVSPSNKDFVTALDDYAEARGLDSALLVRDEAHVDQHVDSLADAFRTTMKEEVGGRSEETFHGTTSGEGTPYALFGSLAQDVCWTGVEMVLFAGRADDLNALVETLGNRQCDDPVSVMFVETGPVIVEGQEDELRDGNITVVQASASDPYWTPGDGDAPEGFTNFFVAYSEYLGDVEVPGPLEDGYAVAHYDALATAVSAIRIAYREGALSLPGVGEAFFRLNRGREVVAASGTLSFFGESGDPVGKLIPIIEVPQSEEPLDPYVTRR